ncbi:MAG: hypothetical protein JW839_03995 [Candidatus Lokiarchaeota archaeon]|nr:hypothetical protein [Candidatus Lokiarchaeota archaeon]
MHVLSRDRPIQPRHVAAASTVLAGAFALLYLATGQSILGVSATIALASAGIAGGNFVAKAQARKARKRAAAIASEAREIKKAKLKEITRETSGPKSGAKEELAYEDPEAIDDYFAFQEALQAIFLIDGVTGELLVSLYPNDNDLEAEECWLMTVLSCFVEQSKDSLEPVVEGSPLRFGRFRDLGKQFLVYGINRGFLVAFVTGDGAPVPDIVHRCVHGVLEHVDAMGIHGLWDQSMADTVSAIFDEHLPWGSIVGYRLPDVLLDGHVARHQQAGDDESADSTEEILDDLYQLRQGFRERRD